MRLLPFAAALLLTACQAAPVTQPATSPTPSPTPTGGNPYGILDTVAPQLPGTLGLGIHGNKDDHYQVLATDASIDQLLTQELTPYASMVKLADGVLAKLKANPPAVGATVDVTQDAAQPLAAKLTLSPDSTALLRVAAGTTVPDSNDLLTIKYDADQHGLLLYKSADGHTQVYSIFHLDRGTASSDVMIDGNIRAHQDFRELRAADAAGYFALQAAKVTKLADGTFDRFSMSTVFLTDPLNPKYDGAVAAVAGHQTADGNFIYDHGDGTPASTDERAAHGNYAIVNASHTLVPAMGADVPTTLQAIVPQDSSLPHFPTDPGTGETFPDPVTAALN